jgi:hypothetical protein
LYGQSGINAKMRLRSSFLVLLLGCPFCHAQDYRLFSTNVVDFTAADKSIEDCPFTVRGTVLGSVTNGVLIIQRVIGTDYYIVPNQLDSSFDSSDMLRGLALAKMRQQPITLGQWSTLSPDLRANSTLQRVDRTVKVLCAMRLPVGSQAMKLNLSPCPLRVLQIRYGTMASLSAHPILPIIQLRLSFLLPARSRNPHPLNNFPAVFIALIGFPILRYLGFLWLNFTDKSLTISS